MMLKSLLIVDDNTPMRETLSDLMRPLFDVIHESGSGEDAIACYETLRHDVVLMDIVLPGIDGIEATERIMRNDHDAVVLIITSYDEPRYRDQAKRAGARGFFPKDDLGKLHNEIQKIASSKSGTKDGGDQKVV